MKAMVECHIRENCIASNHSNIVWPLASYFVISRRGRRDKWGLAWLGYYSQHRYSNTDRHSKLAGVLALQKVA